MTPFTLTPILKRTRWGGRRLGDLLHKEIGSESDYAESWEIADHADGQSVVASGSCSGQTLRQLVTEQNSELFGRHRGHSQFPLLIKFLDANDWLSLQVHPNDEQAKRYNVRENGKTEAWIIVDAQPDSRICAGLKADIDATKLLQCLHDGSIEECLNTFSVQPGDCVFVPSGTVHAISPGIVLAEVQQQSNLTFRLHDWGRVGIDGQSREIHVEDSLACTDFGRGPVMPVTPNILSETEFHRREELVRDHYFVIQRHRLSETLELHTGNQFRILIVLEGRLSVRHSDNTEQMRCGSTQLIPAAAKQVTIIPEEHCVFLEVFLP